jgi:hypothetical protein
VPLPRSPVSLPSFICLSRPRSVNNRDSVNIHVYWFAAEDEGGSTWQTL